MSVITQVKNLLLTNSTLPPSIKEKVANALNELDTDLDVQGHEATPDMIKALSELDEAIIKYDSESEAQVIEDRADNESLEIGTKVKKPINDQD